MWDSRHHTFTAAWIWCHVVVIVAMDSREESCCPRIHFLGRLLLACRHKRSARARIASLFVFVTVMTNHTGKGVRAPLVQALHTNTQVHVYNSPSRRPALAGLNSGRRAALRDPFGIVRGCSACRLCLSMRGQRGRAGTMHVPTGDLAEMASDPVLVRCRSFLS